MSAMIQPKIQVLPDPAAVAAACAELVVATCAEAVADHGAFSLVLAGGSTPKAAYDLLASDDYRDRVDWERTHVFFGDERCVPPSHDDSNYRMADAALLSQVPIPPGQVYRMKGEADPAEAAKGYGMLLRDQFGDGRPLGAGPDLVLLGMGGDGHTASLFPGAAALDEPKHRCVATVKPESGQDRLTMTAPFLNTARHAVVLVTGAGKSARLSEALEGDRDPHRLPIQLIAPTAGDLAFLIDASAAGMDAADA